MSPFYKLTNLPGLEDLSNSSSSNFPTFVNTLYKVCIGVAATLAVIMIMYAGIKFMTNTGSVSSNEEAKSYLQNAILGLVLVLSPAIVFGIINPQILDLKLNFSSLQPQKLDDISTGSNKPLLTDDGSCSVDCAAGKSCQKGVCVDAAVDNSCSAISSGATITKAQEACCVKQGCSPQVKSFDSNLQATEVCTCSATTQSNGQSCTLANSGQCPSGQFCMSTGICGNSTTGDNFPQGHTCKGSDQCGDGLICDPTKLTCQPGTPDTSNASPGKVAAQYGWAGTVQSSSGQQKPAHRGPFSTQKACQDDINSYLTNNSLQSTGDFSCNCNTQLSMQPNCHF